MDKQKKDKIVAIIVTTLISLAVSIIGCILGISPDKIAPDIDNVLASQTATYCLYDTPAYTATQDLTI